MTYPTAQAKIRIRRPAPAVFEAFADPNQMTQFWFPKASGRLETGAKVSWALGTEEDAFAFEVVAIEARSPEFIHIKWGPSDAETEVRWTFEATAPQETIVRITESGFAGTQDEIRRAVLDSTGGFNQVITAAKAFLEHGAAVNIVLDHVADGA